MTISLVKCFDAAYPPMTVPPTCGAVAGYIGRPGRTPHVWTADEWKRFAHLAQFPIWVPDLTANPVLEAQDALGAMRLNGFPVNQPGVIQALVIDYETAGFPEAGWHSELTQQLGKFRTDGVAYGSLSTVVQIEAAHLWVADWNDVPDFNPAGQTVHGHQYEPNVPYGNTRIDYSVIDGYLAARGYRRP